MATRLARQNASTDRPSTGLGPDLTNGADAALLAHNIEAVGPRPATGLLPCCTGKFVAAMATHDMRPNTCRTYLSARQSAPAREYSPACIRDGCSSAPSLDPRCGSSAVSGDYRRPRRNRSA